MGVPNIIINRAGFEGMKKYFISKMEYCMDRHGYNYEVCFRRSKQLLHQLLEWYDFLKNIDLYLESGEERAKRMLEIFDEAMKYLLGSKRRRVYRVDLGLMRYEAWSYRGSSILVIEFRRREGVITVEPKIVYSKLYPPNGFYGD